MSRMDRAIIAALFVVLSFFIGVAIGRAEPYLAGDLLWTTYQGPTVDGTWIQEQLPSQRGIPAVRQTKESLTWDIGAGYRFSNGESWLSQNWSIEAGYRHYGAGVSAGGLAVSDAVYASIIAGANPIRFKSSEYEVTTHMEGGYLRLAKGFDVGHGIEPYLSGGIEIAYQETDFWSRSPRSGRLQTGGFTGIMVTPTIGGGVKYHIARGIKARCGAEFLQTVSESGHPVSSQRINSGCGVEVPVAW